MYKSILYILLSVGGLVQKTVSHPTEAHPGSCTYPASTGALYILSNKKSNSVVSMSIGSNGMLSAGSTTSTRGAGLNGLSGGKLAGPDALFSQAALTVAGKFVFAVNAGSNTISMLKIDRKDPTKLTMVGSPVAIPGEFPNTVAASSKNSLVCAAMTGAKAGISCASFSSRGLSAMDSLRVFDLKQTTPPRGPLNTVSQVFFSADERTLFGTVKGDPTVNNTGFLAVFPVQQGRDRTPASVSQRGTKVSPSGTAVLFGSAVIPGSTDLFVSDASFGAAVLSINEASIASVKAKGIIDGQKATCWATVSDVSKTAFVADVATNRLVEMSLADASVKNIIDLSANGDPGLTDLEAVGNFVYALSPGNGTTATAITVVDATTKLQVQHFTVNNGTLDQNAVGIAVFKS